MSDTEFPAELVERVADAYIDADFRYHGFFYDNHRHVIRDLRQTPMRQKIWEREGSGDDYEPAHNAMMKELRRLRWCAVLRESGHAELVAALKDVLWQHGLFVGPDDAIANATKERASTALRKAGAL